MEKQLPETDGEVNVPVSTRDPLSCCEQADERAGPKSGGAPIFTGMHTLMPLPGMSAMITSIIKDVDAAQTRVSVETYIYRDDKLGRGFAAALCRAAKRGVPTRLLYDPLGSQKTDPAFFDELRSAGVDVRAYRPKGIILGPGSIWPRDHSRVIVVDAFAYTGGAAWGDEWLPQKLGGQGWHDVCVRIHGPVVEDFARLFEQRWKEGNATIVEPLDFSTGDRYPDLALIGDTPDSSCRVYERHRSAIHEAKERVWIENAYFFPPAALLKELYDAAARGVDVRLIVPGPTDLPIIKRAARAEFSQWIERGLRVFEYQPCVLHSKFAVIDDDFSTVGTFNMNPTSIGLVNEVNLFVHHPAFVARIAKLFLSDLTLSKEITREGVAQRPLVEQVVDKLANDVMNVADLVMGPPITDSK